MAEICEIREGMWVLVRIADRLVYLYNENPEIGFNWVIRNAGSGLPFKR